MDGSSSDVRQTIIPDLHQSSLPGSQIASQTSTLSYEGIKCASGSQKKNIKFTLNAVSVRDRPAAYCFCSAECKGNETVNKRETKRCSLGRRNRQSWCNRDSFCNVVRSSLKSPVYKGDECANFSFKREDDGRKTVGLVEVAVVVALRWWWWKPESANGVSR